MQASEPRARSVFPIPEGAAVCPGERARPFTVLMRRSARRIHDEIAGGRLVATLAVPTARGGVGIGALAAILDNPEIIAPDDAGDYERLARDLTRALAYTTVAHELAVCFDALSERQRLLLRFRDRPAAVPPSFVECGRQIGLGAEGARALYHRTCRWLSVDSAGRLLPRVRSAIHAMAVMVTQGGGAREMYDDLRARGLLRGPEDFNDLLVFWRATDLECPCPPAAVLFSPPLPRAPAKGSPTKKPASAAAIRKPPSVPPPTLPVALRQKAQRLSQSCGAFSLEWLGADLPAHDVRAMLMRLGYTPIVPGWFWRERAARNTVASVTRKVLAVTERVAPRDLRGALARTLSDRAFPAPPTHVVTAVALRSGVATRRGRMLVRAGALDPDAELRGVERAVYHLLNDHGPVVAHHTLFDAICGVGYAPATLTTVLQRSPVVQRVAPGRYALIGLTITHADIADADTRAQAFDPAGVLAYNTDGTVTYTVNAGPELLYRGFLDTKLFAAFAGEWRTPSGEPVIVDARRMRGLKAAVRALALEKGERIAVRFDTWTQTVTVARVTNHG